MVCSPCFALLSAPLLLAPQVEPASLDDAFDLHRRSREAEELSSRADEVVEAYEQVLVMDYNIICCAKPENGGDPEKVRELVMRVLGWSEADYFGFLETIIRMTAVVVNYVNRLDDGDGASLVVWGIYDGRKAADAIHAHIQRRQSAELAV